MTHYLFTVTLREADTGESILISDMYFDVDSWDEAHYQIEHWIYERELSRVIEDELC